VPAVERWPSGVGQSRNPLTLPAGRADQKIA
jgi:hypothetical protein